MPIRRDFIHSKIPKTQFPKSIKSELQNMNNYKCAQCGLINWKTEVFCKRCQTPNHYLDQPVQTNDFAIAQNAVVATQTLSRPVTMPDYSSPPPPNVFGSAAGTTLIDGNQPSYSNRPPIRAFGQVNNSPEFENDLKNAERQIRNAWISGAVVCSLTTLAALVISALAPSSEVLPATPFEMLISVVIFGGLTIGVYFKSRTCAVLLCGLFILDKIIMWAATGKMSGALMAFIFIYYFAYGIQGTFAYHKLMKQKS